MLLAKGHRGCVKCCVFLLYCAYLIIITLKVVLTGNPHSLTPLLITAYRGTSASGFALQVACVRLSPILQSCFCTVDQVRLTSVMALRDNFYNYTHCNFKIVEVNSKDYNIKSFRQRCLIVLLLLISGNVQPNQGPVTASASSFETPADFKSRYGLGFIHLNVQSLISKMDMVRIWVQSTDADVIVLTETWLNKSVLDKDICINGCNVYRTDRQKRGGGVAIFIYIYYRSVNLSA